MTHRMKRFFIFLAVLLGGSGGYAQTQIPVEATSFVGFDSFGNEMVALTLLPNDTFEYSEKFLDGSSLVDAGKWVIENDVLTLRSGKKVMRKHNYQTYKKAYKFRYAMFELTKEGFKPVQKSLSNDNAYLMSYRFLKR